MCLLLPPPSSFVGLLKSSPRQATMSNQVTSNPTSQTVAQLLPKLHDVDPDYRFMSLNDLFTVLTIGKPDFLHNDYNTAARAVDGILKTLDDQNGEVQNLAIKWYKNLDRLIDLTNITQSRAARHEDP